MVERQINSLPSSLLDPNTDHHSLSHSYCHSHSVDINAHLDYAKVLSTCSRIRATLLSSRLSLSINLRRCIAINTVDSYPCDPHWYPFIDIFHLFLHASTIYLGKLLDADEKRKEDHDASFIVASYDVCLLLNFIFF